MKPSDLTVTHHFVDLPKLRMHYVERGSGPVVVLLHGFPEMWWGWRYQLGALADAGFRVIAPDLRGYGETDKDGPYDLDTIVADVCNLIDSLGVPHRVAIVGHDWGGAVAWHLAAHRPEYCARLVVMNCPHPQIMRDALLRRPKWSQVKKSWYMFFFQVPWIPEHLLTRQDAAGLVQMLRGSAIDRTHFGPEELQPFREAIGRPGAASAMIGWYRAAFRSSVRAASWPQITVETLLIWGKADVALGFDDLVPGTERHASRLRVEPIESSGHFVQSERPDLVNPLLVGFLEPYRA